LIVTLIQGGEHVSDLATLRDQPDLFGAVASDSTAFRAVNDHPKLSVDGHRKMQVGLLA
jgi:hypothetical protein